MTGGAEVRGKLYASGSARAEPARLCRSAAGGFAAVLDAGGETRGLGALGSITERVAGSARRAQFADGSAFVTEDAEGLDRVIGGHIGGWSRFVARMEKPRLRTLALLGMLLVALAAGLRLAVPFAADAAVALVPLGFERHVGKEAFSQLDAHLFMPSGLAADRQADLRGLFARVAASTGVSPAPELLFRSAPALGANAIALPGGPVVMSDALIAIAPSDDALAGVMAHELGHLRERHGLRRLARSVAFLFLASVVFGDTGSISDELVALAGLAVANSYSREFEREADAAAVDALGKLGIPSTAFAEMLETLQRNCGARCTGGWLATHPPTGERVKSVGGR